MTCSLFGQYYVQATSEEVCVCVCRDPRVRCAFSVHSSLAIVVATALAAALGGEPGAPAAGRKYSNVCLLLKPVGFKLGVSDPMP